MQQGVQSARGPPVLRKQAYRSNRAIPLKKNTSSRYGSSTRKFSIFRCAVIFISAGLLINAFYLKSLIQDMHMDFFAHTSNDTNSNQKHGVDHHIRSHQTGVKKLWSQIMAGHFLDEKPVETNNDERKRDNLDHRIHHRQDNEITEIDVTRKDRAANISKKTKNSADKNASNHVKYPANISKENKSKNQILVGSKRGHIECDIDVDDLVYWNDVQGLKDREFISPFVNNDSETDDVKYLTFEPDRGGWNNIRMSMEIVFVFAAATGRTVVLPPDQPLYLLNKDDSKKERGFADFFPLDFPEFLKQVPVITAAEFLKREGGENGRLPQTDDMERLMKASEGCVNRKISDNFCQALYTYFGDLGFKMPVSGSHSCVIFDNDTFLEKDMTSDVEKHVKKFCSDERTPFFFTQKHQQETFIHFAANQKETRIFNHFYSFILFTDPRVDNHFKRLVRDFLHYKSSIFCAAGKVIRLLQRDGKELGFDVDDKNAGGFSALHIRRGDFQFSKQKISAEEWWENTQEVWLPNEILYIATDEKDRTFFDPIKEHRTIRFLSDYWDEAGLDDVDPNYIGMIETIIASRGRAFAGTWFSTFTAYINRMRGYHGMDMKLSYYGTTERKYAMHTWTYPEPGYVAREFPLVWDGIDGDEFVFRETESVHPGQDQKLDTQLARGVSGLPFTETPSLIGAERAKIQCDVDVDTLAYFNDPQGTRDIEFESPFGNDEGETKYITFEPDSGGWNNIRMCMEIIFIFAAATGRTLVMPPDQPLYLLHADAKKRGRGFADFFPLDKPEFRNHINIISTEEFLRREGGDQGRFPIPADKKKAILNAQAHCTKRKKSEDSCEPLIEYTRSIGYVPDINGNKNCMIFDEDVLNGGDLSPSDKKRVDDFCGVRKPVLYSSELHDAPLIHFQASHRDYRLLNHFYGFLLFTNPQIDHFYKRFVRDFLHYKDEVFCAAGKIVLALQEESKKRGFELDEEGGGGYSSFHVRRGDLQYKKVKISGEEWQQNTKELFLPKEILYIATDERDKSFFDPLAEHHDLKFLDDYWDYAGLGDLDPNFMGMIDTIVASRGRIFVGTYFSTFSGYINRMRGYHGMKMKDSFYGTTDRKTSVHTWENIAGSVFAKEWPTGWIAIDGDNWPSKEKF